METLAPRLTYADVAALPDDGHRYELLDGDLVMSPAPSFDHQNIASELLMHLRLFVKQHGLGAVVAAPLDVVLDPDGASVQPDLVFLDTARLPCVAEDGTLRGVPSLVVEVISPSSRRRDEVTKRRLYERFGVPEYWLVDPEGDAVKVYRLCEGSYGRADLRTAEAGDVLDSPQLPGFALPLQTLFDR